MIVMEEGGRFSLCLSDTSPSLKSFEDESQSSLRSLCVCELSAARVHRDSYCKSKWVLILVVRAFASAAESAEKSITKLWLNSILRVLTLPAVKSKGFEAPAVYFCSTIVTCDLLTSCPLTDNS